MDPNDLLAEMHTNSEGEFELFGQEDEVGRFLLRNEPVVLQRVVSGWQHRTLHSPHTQLSGVEASEWLNLFCSKKESLALAAFMWVELFVGGGELE